MSFAVKSGLPVHLINRPRERIMTAATYTFDVFSTLDGFGSTGGDWAGYWGKQGPELLAHRLALYGQEQRMVLGPTPTGSSRTCWPRARKGRSP